MVLYKDQSGKFLGGSWWIWVFLHVIDRHDISGVRHVLFGQLLHVETDIVTAVRCLYLFVVHLNAEDVSGASGRIEFDIDSRCDLSLFHSASHHITDSLDFVHSRYRHSERLLIVTLWWFHHFLQRVDQSVSLHLLLLDLDLESL